MSKTIEQVGLMAELSLLERGGFDLASMWGSTAADAASGDASRVNDVLILDARTNDMIRAIKTLVVKMVRAGMDVDDIWLNRCLALLCAVGEMSVHYSETVEAARRVAGLMREVQAARGFH